MVVDGRGAGSEAEVAAGDGRDDGGEGRKRVCFEIMSVNQEKGVSSGKNNALVAVKERMIIRERLHQSCCGLFGDVVVIPDLRAKDGGFQESFVPHPVSSAVVVD